MLRKFLSLLAPMPVPLELGVNHPYAKATSPDRLIGVVMGYALAFHVPPDDPDEPCHVAAIGDLIESVEEAERQAMTAELFLNAHNFLLIDVETNELVLFAFNMESHIPMWYETLPTRRSLFQ